MPGGFSLIDSDLHYLYYLRYRNVVRTQMIVDYVIM